MSIICKRGLTALFLICVTTVAHADLQLNGVADFTELRRSFYLGGLCVERPAQDGQVLVDSDQRKRMVLKITADRWSPRSFSGHWTRSLLINNDAETLNAFGEAVIEFNNLLREDLVHGDVLEIERADDGSTEVRLNSVALLNVSRPGFTEMLLRTWIGSRPPSTEFRQQMLGLELSPERVARFKALGPGQQRVAAIAAWTNEEADQESVEPPAAEADTDDSRFIAPPLVPPSGDTVVAVRAAPPAAIEPAAKAAPAGDSAAPGTNIKPQPQPEAVSKPPAAPVAAAGLAMSPASNASSGGVVPASLIVESAAPQPGTHEEAGETREASGSELSAEEERALVELYQNMVVRKILGQVQYPDYALRRGLEGVIELRVKVNRGGEILDIEEIAPTRYDVLNKAGRRAVEQIGEFPRVPAALAGDVIQVDVPIRFQLR